MLIFLKGKCLRSLHSVLTRTAWPRSVHTNRGWGRAWTAGPHRPTTEEPRDSLPVTARDPAGCSRNPASCRQPAGRLNQTFTGPEGSEHQERVRILKQNRKWAGHAGLLHKGLTSLKTVFGLDRPTPCTSQLLPHVPQTSLVPNSYSTSN